MPKYALIAVSLAAGFLAGVAFSGFLVFSLSVATAQHGNANETFARIAEDLREQSEQDARAQTGPEEGP